LSICITPSPPHFYKPKSNHCFNSELRPIVMFNQTYVFLFPTFFHILHSVVLEHRHPITANKWLVKLLSIVIVAQSQAILRMILQNPMLKAPTMHANVTFIWFQNINKVHQTSCAMTTILILKRWEHTYNQKPNTPTIKAKHSLPNKSVIHYSNTTIYHNPIRWPNCSLSASTSFGTLILLTKTTHLMYEHNFPFHQELSHPHCLVLKFQFPFSAWKLRACWVLVS